MINYDLKKIKAIVFDVDGVLSRQTITLASTGEPLRTVNINTYDAFLEKYQLSDEEIIYVGDDIPDYEVMRRCGCPCCPADACSDIKEISCYVSSANGGEGVGRDIVEQVLRAKGHWLSNAKAFGW